MASIDLNDKISITADDQGPVVNIVAWICMVTMCMGVLTRLALKLTATLKTAWDDLMIAVAMIIVICQTIIVSEQVKNGLGQRIDTLTTDQLIGFQKNAYAADMLMLPIICLSKTSTLVLLYALTPSQKWRTYLKICSAIVVVWGFSSFIALAFRCPMPEPWGILDEKCFSPTTFWSITGVFDIIGELLIMAVPIFFVRHLKMTFSRKAMVVVAFLFRLIVVLFTILRLLVIANVEKNTNDQTFDAHRVSIYTQLVITLSVLVACIPFLRAFMDSLESGLLANHGQHGNFKSVSNELGYALKGMSGSGSKGYRSCDDSLDPGKKVEIVRPQQPKPKPASMLEAAHHARGESDGESMTSAGAGSQREIIKKAQMHEEIMGVAQ